MTMNKFATDSKTTTGIDEIHGLSVHIDSSPPPNFFSQNIVLKCFKLLTLPHPV